MSAYWNRMTKRERLLAAAVGSALFLFANLLLLRFASDKRGQLLADAANRQSELESLEILYAERDFWNARADWLRSHQPALANESTAGVALLDELKGLAQASGVTLANPSIGVTESAGEYRSVSLSAESRSSWDALIRFLHTLQQPDRFVALESANFQIDPQDPSKIYARLKIGKWYAP